MQDRFDDNVSAHTRMGSVYVNVCTCVCTVCICVLHACVSQCVYVCMYA